jgi:uncharacterized protein YbjT (DUF2867 family)
LLDERARLLSALDGLTKENVRLKHVLGNRVDQHRAVIEAAKAAGVGLIHYRAGSKAECFEHTRDVIGQSRRHTDELGALAGFWSAARRPGVSLLSVTARSSSPAPPPAWAAKDLITVSPPS